MSSSLTLRRYPITLRSANPISIRREYPTSSSTERLSYVTVNIPEHAPVGSCAGRDGLDGIRSTAIDRPQPGVYRHLRCLKISGQQSIEPSTTEATVSGLMREAIIEAKSAVKQMEEALGRTETKACRRNAVSWKRP